MTGHVLFISQLDNDIMEIKLGLEEQNIRVSVQPNPLQAVNEAKVHVPDVVVTEVLTRPIGGFEVAFAISHGKHGFTAPVIFYTDFYRDERTRRDITAKYGAIHYFVKPFQREALIRAIKIVLEESSRSHRVVGLQSGEDVSPQVLPLKAIGIPKPVSEPIVSEISQLIESPAIGFPPSKNRLVTTELLKKEPAVGTDSKIVAPGIPRKVTGLEILPRPAPVSAKGEKAENQAAVMREEPKPSVAVAVNPDLPPKRKDTTKPVILPLRPVRNLNRSWGTLTLLVVVTCAALFFLWHKFVRTLPTPASTPSFEEIGTSSPSFPLANPTSTPAEVGREGGTMPHEPVSEYLPKTPSNVIVQAENPSEPSTKPVKDTPGQNATLSPRPDLVVTDISISVREPQLRHKKNPALSNELLRQMGEETFVVRVVIDGKGTVREVTLLKAGTSSASLPQELSDAIWQWEYRAVDGREAEVFFKHYSFRVAVH